MDVIVDFFRTYPELAIFLTIGVGFWLGGLRYRSFTLGTVTSVLLVGVVFGQMNIPISGPLKSVFFLLFLFSIGYSVGPQFFHSLRSDGVKQVVFAVILCVLCLVVTVIIAKMMGYNVGQAAGLFAGAQTISAVIGVGGDTISTLNATTAEKQAWINIIPVCYAVTYIFGTIGSAYILGTIGPMMLGGIKKVREQTKELESQMSQSSLINDPAYMNANRPIVFRAYRVESDWFSQPRTVTEIEDKLLSMGKQIFVERVRVEGKVLEESPDTKIKMGDEVVLSGRRETVVPGQEWIGPEVDDPQLLTFPVNDIFVLLTNKTIKCRDVEHLRSQKFMHGVLIKSIKRGMTEMPVLPGTKLYAGDTLELVGLDREVKAAAHLLGFVDVPTNKTDMVFVGFGIFIGGVIGALTIHLGGVPVSLSTSGGALIMGLLLGWLRTKNPSYGHIPESSLWIVNNLGLNMFIAVVGITAGPTFISGIKEIGFPLFLVGIVATTVPLILGVWIGDKFFKFHPAVNLGCNAGARTTTAALGAIQESLGSTLPALGYTVTYAVGNTLLILWGVVIVLLMQ